MTSTLSDEDFVVETALGLRLLVTFSGAGAVFDDFFAGYDRSFVLPDEKEDEDGFRRCLDLNHGTAYGELEQRYGSFREACVVAYDTASGQRIGGANLIAMPSGACVTANLNYIYVDERARRGGHFRRLASGVRELVGTLFPNVQDALVFIEQNDPFAMSPEAYQRDTQFTGLDQFDRLRIWSKIGARVVDFPYVQPALSVEQSFDDTLLYSMYGSTRASLESGVLLEHLRRFFGISVLKGVPLDTDVSAARQIAQLEQVRAARQSIPLLDPSPLLNQIRGPSDVRALWPTTPTTFREALHTPLSSR